jgi:ATP/ADP translocase
LFNASSIIVVAPYIGGILLVVIVAWIVAAKALAKRYNALTAEKEAEANAVPVETQPTLAPKERATTQV